MRDVGEDPDVRHSWQLRAMMAVMTFRLLGSAWAINASGDRLAANPAFEIVASLMSMESWVYVFLILGLLSIGGIIAPRSMAMRMLLTVSVGVSLAWGLSLIATGEPTLAIIHYLSFAAIDFVAISLRLEKLEP